MHKMMDDDRQKQGRYIQGVKVCGTREDIVRLAEKYDIDLTREEAEVFLEEMDDIDLDHKVLAMVAGGKNW